MRRQIPVILFFFLVAVPCCLATPKPHVVALGGAMKVKLFLGLAEAKSMDIKVRPLTVDGKVKEFTTGEMHEITDRTFVVQRAYRVNDSLPNDPAKLPRWRWQRAGWIEVDRATGHVAQIRLPDFDPFYSLASWYRDWVAYCGITPDGQHVYAVVTQLGRKKPMLHKELGKAKNADDPDSECAAPGWERQPARVTFHPVGGEVFTVNVHGQPFLPAPAESADEDEE
jgi:hypothetical protein